MHPNGATHVQIAPVQAAMWFRSSFGRYRRRGRRTSSVVEDYKGSWPSDYAGSSSSDCQVESAVARHSIAEAACDAQVGDTRTSVMNSILDWINIGAELGSRSLASSRLVIVRTTDALALHSPVRLCADAVMGELPDAISRVEISARTKPEDAFARRDPDTLSPKDHDDLVLQPLRQLHRLPDPRSHPRSSRRTSPPRRAVRRHHPLPHLRTHVAHLRRRPPRRRIRRLRRDGHRDPRTPRRDRPHALPRSQQSRHRPPLLRRNRPPRHPRRNPRLPHRLRPRRMARSPHLHRPQQPTPHSPPPPSSTQSYSP